MSDEEKKPSAYQQALYRLNVREYGAVEMATYLRRKGYERGEIDDAVAQLVAKDLISDARFSKIIARHTAQRGKGPAYIRAKLRQKGIKIDPAQARELFEDSSSESELELARRILETKYPRATENMKERQRAYQGLIRRGISHDVARACFKQSREEDDTSQ
jgi:regulatory protein